MYSLCICSGPFQLCCETVETGGLTSGEPYKFKVAYDKLVIASGAEPLTFGIKGVKEHAFFLREVTHAQEIRKKLLLNLMLSENPGWFRFAHVHAPRIIPDIILPLSFIIRSCMVCSTVCVRRRGRT